MDNKNRNRNNCKNNDNKNRDINNVEFAVERNEFVENLVDLNRRDRNNQRNKYDR